MNHKKNISHVLIKACRRRDAKAQRQLYDLHVDRLYYVVRRYVAEDYSIKNILQDIFLKVFINIDKYDEKKGAFSTWINTIAIRESLNHLRGKKIVFTPLENLTVEPTGIEDNMTQLEVDDILKYLSLVPEKYRIVFNLKIMDGYSHKEIAALLNMTESTSRSYLTRSKKILREILEGLEIKSS